MTVRRIDVEYAFDDPDEGWFGMAQPADEAPVRPPEPVQPVEPVATHPDDGGEDTDRWFVADMIAAAPVAPEPARREDPPRADVEDRPVSSSIAATLNIVPTRRSGFVAAAPKPSWESRLSNSGAWDFKARSGGSRSRSRSVLIAAAIAAGILAVVGAVVVLRGPGPAVEESTPTATTESAKPAAPTTSAAPLPPSAAPLPPPPPGPPPPPPPTAEQLKPPATRQYTPQYRTPNDPPKKPQTNVTRAPLSATPPPPPRDTDKGRATPGQSGSHGFFG
ncbi:hypothetical protein TUM20985_25320 [Mycobacterium antarcticum]|uniref:hypothetical protein n=1 Tax=unclassified Mycolicibacterium TaxID=2636767 RepID=UPI00238F1C71|nr:MULTISPECIES: hypothetical protein [unclassified Mycolicibacterium]BDX31985.1 hypothetical protein TUM20985_25320 [Mycolicibacterium sp. TUM20985]GLP81076.1 hypothetical protein TUM20984_24960 [Mycolicibacterium sp. TUM20984]